MFEVSFVNQFLMGTVIFMLIGLIMYAALRVNGQGKD